MRFTEGLVSAQSAAIVAEQLALIQANKSLADAQKQYDNSQTALLHAQKTLAAAQAQR